MNLQYHHASVPIQVYNNSQEITERSRSSSMLMDYCIDGKDQMRYKASFAVVISELQTATNNVMLSIDLFA